MTENYQSFEDLPEWLKDFMRKIQDDPEQAVFRPIPALDKQSIITLMNQGEEGERKLRAYMTVVIGKFF